LPDLTKDAPMSKFTLWFSRAAIGAAIALLATGQPVLAQRGGGGGGAGHGGGWGGGGWGGGGWGHSGFHRGYGGFYGGYFLDDPFLYGPYYYGGLPYYYPPPPPPVQPAPYFPVAPINPSVDAGPEKIGAPRPLTDTIATIEVHVAPDAEIWFDGNKTQQRGSERLFKTPPLTPGRTFTYQVRATWTVDGTPITRTQTVQAEAGKRSVVNFDNP
jgi:uncharacterized protein (TIGR03000 family)